MHNSAYLLSIGVMKDKKYLYKQNLNMHSLLILAWGGGGGGGGGSMSVETFVTSR